MKHFINIFVLIILTGFFVGLTVVIVKYPPNTEDRTSPMGVLFLPLILMFVAWMGRLNKQYN